MIRVATPPSGGGTEYEGINLLTGKKRQRFSADGTSTEYKLAESFIDSVDSVKVNGNTVSNYTVSLSSGTVTFNSAPSQGIDNVEIAWRKGNGERDLIEYNSQMQFYGLADDTRIFLYSDWHSVSGVGYTNTYKNIIRYSDLADGVPSAEYFPANNFIKVGSDNDAVTDIQRQYDRLIIFKEGCAYYATYEAITDSTGETIVTFPMYPLNKSHGSKIIGGGQVLNNYVTTLDTSLVQWINTEIIDERNAEIISDKIQQWINDVISTYNLRWYGATMDYQEDKEYWLAIANEIMIYNYGNQCYSLLRLPVEVNCMTDYNGTIYAGTNDGEILEFDKSLTKYGDEIIKAEWQSGYYDFGVEERKKTMKILWITLKPWFNTSLDINYASDRDNGSENKTILNRTATFSHMNFANFSFNTQRSVRPFRVKLKAKKFAFLKLILKNEKSDEKVTINSIAIKRAIGGEVK